MDSDVKDQKPLGCGKKFLAAAGKQIGIVLLIIIYSCLGGKIFQVLEESKEEEVCWQGRTDETKIRIQALKDIWQAWIEEEENTTALVLRMDESIKIYRDEVLKIGGDFTNEDCSGSSWSWANAVLFSVTIISTIGYGHIAPATWEGQIVCICYAVVGLPIFGIFLSLLGDTLAEHFLATYKRLSAKISRLIDRCCSCSVFRDDRTLPPSSSVFSSPDPLPEIDSIPQEKEIVRRDSERIRQEINTDKNGSDITLHQIWERAPKYEETQRPKYIATFDTFEESLKSISNNELNLRDKNSESEEEVTTVPLTVSMIVIGLYLGLGSILFGYFEGWGSMEAAYFSFITLSTIGFGDFVPGTESALLEGELIGQLRMICAAVYIMFGMALLAMVFNLMQEKVVYKIRWIVQRWKKDK